MASLNKVSVDDINVKGKKVLVRCDFNVPLKEGVITNDNRITAALPTLKKLINDGGRLILCSHLGKPKNGPEEKFSLAPVAVRLSELLGKNVVFANDDEVVGENAKKAVNEMKDGDVVLNGSTTGENFVVFTAMYDYVQINFRWIEDQTFGNFGLYKVEQTGTAVTVSYTVDGVKVGEVSKGFGNLEFGAAFEPYYYSANGSNDFYMADAIAEVSQDTTVEMKKIDNYSEYSLGQTITIGEEKYVVTGNNLVPNSNFNVGTIGWYSANGDAADFTTDAASGTITTADGGLWRAWETTIGRTYIIKFTSSAACDSFVVSQKDSVSNSENGTAIATAVAGENMVAFKATEK